MACEHRDDAIERTPRAAHAVSVPLTPSLLALLKRFVWESASSSVHLVSPDAELTLAEAEAALTEYLAAQERGQVLDEILADARARHGMMTAEEAAEIDTIFERAEERQAAEGEGPAWQERLAG
jgi:hypothetical protein